MNIELHRQHAIKTLLIKILIIALGLLALGGSSISGTQQNYLHFKQRHPETKQKEKVNPGGEPLLEVKLFKIDSGWGYDIYRNNKLYIHQPFIPAFSGNNTFSSEEEARKTAELIIIKIQKNIIPPTVTITELDSMGILIPTQTK